MSDEGQVSEYRWLGDRSAVQGYTIGLTCDHCRVSWGGCAAECCCPECGSPKGYHDYDADLCYCEQCLRAYREIAPLVDALRGLIDGAKGGGYPHNSLKVAEGVIGRIDLIASGNVA